MDFFFIVQRGSIDLSLSASAIGSCCIFILAVRESPFWPLVSKYTITDCRVRDSSRKMHKKGILYHGLTVCEVSMMVRATIVAFRYR